MDSDSCKFALISRGAERGTVRYVLQAATPEIAQAWVADISLILETQRDFLNGRGLNATGLQLRHTLNYLT